MFSRNKWLCLALSLCLLVPFGGFPAFAAQELWIPNVYSSNMVLQAGKTVAITGKAEKGVTVSAVFDSGENQYTSSAAANASNEFKITFEHIFNPGYTEYTLTVSDGSDSKVFTNIVFGDVYILAGQSNMEVTMWQSRDSNGAKEPVGDDIISPDCPNVRRLWLQTEPHSDRPQDEIKTQAGGEWAAISPSNSRDIYTIGFYFARTIQQQLDYPVGLIQCARGGSNISSWLKNGGLFNERIYPFRNLGIKGALWYQGEADAQNYTYGWGFGPEEYTNKQIQLIENWRELFGQDFVFGYNQLANFNQTNFHLFRNAQLEAFKHFENSAKQQGTQNLVGLIGLVDYYGNPDNIHPPNKKELGHRYATWAKAAVYGNGTEYSGPIANRAIKSSDGRISVIFDHVGNGLETIDSSDTVKGFEVVDTTGGVHTVTAVISGTNKVIINESVPGAASVQYCHKTELEPLGNLGNSVAGLAAPGFGALQITEKESRQLWIPNVYADNMVLQAGKPVVITGAATDGTEITAVFDDGENQYTSSAVADTNDEFKVIFENVFDPGYTEYTLTVSDGNDSLVYQNIVFGDVFIFAGQSNMEVPMWQSKERDAEPGVAEDIASADYRYLRGMKVENGKRPSAPQKEVPIQYRWSGIDRSKANASDDRTIVENTSTIAFYFGKAVMEQNQYPVGLIQVAWGGTAIDSWFKNAKRDYIYNDHIYPFKDMNIKALLWYQGESDAESEAWYNSYMTNQITMIEDCRELFGADIPFCMVQLPNYTKESYREVRDQQLGVFKHYEEAYEKNTVGLLSTVDLNTNNNLHPGIKREVARRYLTWANSVVYGNGGEYAGPAAAYAVKTGGNVEITFTHAGDGLKTTDGTPNVRGFEIVDALGIVHPVTAAISGKNEVTINESIENAAYIQYAYKGNNNPAVNLCGSVNGLTAYGFGPMEITEQDYIAEVRFCNEAGVPTNNILPDGKILSVSLVSPGEMEGVICAAVYDGNLLAAVRLIEVTQADYSGGVAEIEVNLDIPANMEPPLVKILVWESVYNIRPVLDEWKKASATPTPDPGGEITAALEGAAYVYVDKGKAPGVMGIDENGNHITNLSSVSGGTEYHYYDPGRHTAAAAGNGTGATLLVKRNGAEILKIKQENVGQYTNLDNNVNPPHLITLADVGKDWCTYQKRNTYDYSKGNDNAITYLRFKYDLGFNNASEYIEIEGLKSAKLRLHIAQADIAEGESLEIGVFPTGCWDGRYERWSAWPEWNELDFIYSAVPENPYVEPPLFRASASQNSIVITKGDEGRTIEVDVTGYIKNVFGAVKSTMGYQGSVAFDDPLNQRLWAGAAAFRLCVISGESENSVSFYSGRGEGNGEKSPRLLITME